MSRSKDRKQARRRWKRGWRVAGVAVPLAVAGVVSAAADGAFSPGSAFASTAQANPVSPQMIGAMTTGTSLRVSVVPPMSGGSPAIGAIPRGRAEQAAITQLRRPGSAVMGGSLAYVRLPSDGGRSRLAWLISVDPAGGLFSIGPPARLGNYCVEIVSAASGQWLMTAVGHSPALPELPSIPAPR